MHDPNPASKKAREGKYDVIAVRNAVMCCEASWLLTSGDLRNNSVIFGSFQPEPGVHGEFFCGNQDPAEPGNSDQSNDKGLRSVSFEPEAP